jgi:hypothetical protein
MADEESTRRTVTVSKKVDVAVRTHLAQTGLHDADLSQFVEDAVRWRVLDQTISRVRSMFADVAADELQAIVEEAVPWARTGPCPELGASVSR